MKTMFALFIAITVVLTASSCLKKSKTCTSEFRMVALRVCDPNQRPVILDTSYTLVESTQFRFTIPADSSDRANGIYQLIDDNRMSLIPEGEVSGIRFIGVMDSVEVMNERYTVSQDGCHIQFLSGKNPILYTPSQ